MHEHKPRYLGNDIVESSNPLDKLEVEKAKGNISRIRTVKLSKKKYIHVGVRKSGKGKRGGKTIAGKVHVVGEHKKRRARFVKGSKKAKEFMAKIRAKRGKKKGGK